MAIVITNEKQHGAYKFTYDVELTTAERFISKAFRIPDAASPGGALVLTVFPVVPGSEDWIYSHGFVPIFGGGKKDEQSDVEFITYIDEVTGFAETAEHNFVVAHNGGTRDTAPWEGDHRQYGYIPRIFAQTINITTLTVGPAKFHAAWEYSC